MNERAATLKAYIEIMNDMGGIFISREGNKVHYIMDGRKRDYDLTIALATAKRRFREVGFELIIANEKK